MILGFRNESAIHLELVELPDTESQQGISQILTTDAIDRMKPLHGGGHFGSIRPETGADS
jgi:hypothetical protein